MAPSSTSTLSSRAYQNIRSSTPTLAGSLAFTRSRGLAARSKKRRHNEGMASPLDTERLFVRGGDLGQGDNTALLLDAYGNYPRGVRLNASRSRAVLSPCPK